MTDPSSSPWQKSGVAPRGARGEGERMRPPGKTRGRENIGHIQATSGAFSLGCARGHTSNENAVRRDAAAFECRRTRATGC